MSAGVTKVNVSMMNGAGPGSGVDATVAVGNGLHPIHPAAVDVTVGVGAASVGTGTVHPGEMEDGRCNDTIRCVAAVRR